MDFKELAKNRRTIHQFEAGSIPKEVLLRAIEVANFAPNHRLTFPWRFRIVGAKTRERLAEINVGLKCASDASAEMINKVREKMLIPSLIVVSCLRVESPVQAKEDYAAVCCAIQNFMLSLAFDGFGTKWSTGKVTRAPETYSLLGMDTEKEEISGFVFAGKPRCVPEPPKRPSLDALVTEYP